MPNIQGWRKSSFSNGNGGNNCVEVMQASASRQVFVRDSKHRTSWIAFEGADFAAFIKGVKNGEFDDLA